MTIVNFIIKNILTQTAIIIALVSLAGLILQKKNIGEIISGTFKTLLGFMVLSAGSGVLVSTIGYFGDMFSEAFHLDGIIPSTEVLNGIAMNDLGLGTEISFTFLAIFIVNIIIARLTRWKYIFLTGQAILWMSTMVTLGGYIAGLKGPSIIIVGGLVGGTFAVLMPALAQKYMRMITGSDDIALGHFCTTGYLFTALVGKFVGNQEKSTEDIQLPKSMEFLQDTYLSIMVVMVPLYIITAIFAGPEFSAQFSGTTNYIVYAFLQSVQFAVGVYVLLAGVRLLLAEIVPAFRGIALKVVPDAIPALDCPVLFPYAPNAVIIGFVSTTIGTILAMLILPIAGLPMLLPLMLTNFFAGGTAGVFGNATGGIKGAFIGGLLHGFFITTLIPALLVGGMNSLGLVNMTAGDVDCAVAALLYVYILTPILKAF